MVRQTAGKRLSAAERRLQMSRPILREIYIHGGLVQNIYKQARIDGEIVMVPEAGEEFGPFQQRVRTVAQTRGANWIVYGGLPVDPVDWATPPGMEEALAAAGTQAIDEIDS